MTTRHLFRWFWLVCAAVCVAIFLCADDATTQSQGTANVKTGGGLSVVTFTVPAGTLTVSLPDDMVAGDTISGTVVAEPKGQTKEERAKNQDELNGLVLEIDGKPVEPFAVTAKEREATIQQTFWLYHGDEAKLVPNATDTQTAKTELPGPKVTGGETGTPRPISRPMATSESGGVARFSVVLVKSRPSGPEVARATIPYYFGESPELTPSGALIHPDPKITPTFIIPPLGQTGRPMVIIGRFDGNASNTTLRTTVQDFEKNTENVSGGFGLLAESPRKAVFSSPENVTGPIEITVKEGDKQTTGTYRNIGVNLSAPKTSLLKGEHTPMLVLVTGAQGIKEPLPLTLESHGVITMEGGNYQQLLIQPSQVSADGRYTTTRVVTGVQTGVWGATATVMIHQYDFCLQDDSNPRTAIRLNSFTGNYSFTPPGGTSLSGTGTVTTNGCGMRLKDTFDGKDSIFPGDSTFQLRTLPENARIVGAKPILTPIDDKRTPTPIGPPVQFFPERLEVNIDRCAKIGSIELSGNYVEVNFHARRRMTITDRNTTDNTCAVQ